MPRPSSASGDGRDAPGPDEVYCRDCGAIISARAEICPSCGIRQRRPASSALEDVLAGGNPVVAALLSAFLPGLGQIYNRQLERGLLFIGGSMLAAFSVVVFGLGFVLFPAVWLYAIYDAYRGAEQFTPDGAADAPPDAAVDAPTAEGRAAARADDGDESDTS